MNPNLEYLEAAAKIIRTYCVKKLQQKNIRSEDSDIYLKQAQKCFSNCLTQQVIILKGVEKYKLEQILNLQKKQRIQEK